jgi:hypothetical protein
MISWVKARTWIVPKETESNISIMCPNLTCRKVLMVPHNCRGKTVRCRACGTNIRVPALKGSGSSSLPPQPPANRPNEAA